MPLSLWGKPKFSQSVPHGITVTSLGNYSAVENDESEMKCELISQQQGAFLNNLPRPFSLCVPDTTYLVGPSCTFRLVALAKLDLTQYHDCALELAAFAFDWESREAK